MSLKNINKTSFLGALLAAWFLCLPILSLHAQELEPAEQSAKHTPPDSEPAVLAELRALLGGNETRIPGSAANLDLEQRVYSLFADSGLENGALEFLAPCLVPGPATISAAGVQNARLYQMHPSLFRPGNFPETEFDAPLVYLGVGGVDDLDGIKGVPLEGAVALMEMTCGTAWMRLLQFGVRGFVFIGNDNMMRLDALSKVYASEVPVPRYYLAPEEAAHIKAALAGGKVIKAHFNTQPTTWENRRLRTPWVFIPGADPDLAREVMLVIAPLDANAVVPELAFGAQAGANLNLLLKLFEEFRINPPARSVVLAAVNAHTQGFLGERVLAWHLLATGAPTIRELLNADRRAQALLADYYGKLKLETVRQEDEDELVAWRVLADDSTGRNILVKNPLVLLAKRDVNTIKMEIMQLIQQKPQPPDLAERKAELETKKEHYVKILALFNKFGYKTKLSDLDDNERGMLAAYVKQVLELNQIQSRLNDQQQRMDAANDRIRDVLADRRVAAVISLELDWDSEKIGFGSLNRDGAQRWGIRWGVNTTRLAEQIPAVQQATMRNLLVDTMTMQGGLSESFFFSRENSGILAFQAADKTPAFLLANTFTSDGRAFLPSDTVTHLNHERIAEQSAFVPLLLRAVFDDEVITSSSELTLTPSFSLAPIWSLLARTFRFDEMASTSVLPELPVQGSVVILRAPEYSAINPSSPYGIVAGDVIDALIGVTDERAVAPFYGLDERSYTSTAFQFDESFTKVNYTIDAGEIQTKVDSNVRVMRDIYLTMFPCIEIPLMMTEDPSRVSAMPIVIPAMVPLTARGNAPPRKFGVIGVRSEGSSKFVPSARGAPAAFYFPVDEQIKLITDNKRLLLNATTEEPEGAGYASSDHWKGDTIRVMAEDMSTVNHFRLRKLKDVASDLVRDFLARGDKSMEEARKAFAASDYLAYSRALYDSLGAQVKSYDQAKQTVDDMLKAVVVYMALLLPFCLFIEKLLFKFVKIEAEMAAFAGLFVLTYIVFRFIHPAFRVAQAAEAIFIAFVMGALGLFVIAILRGRFEGEMQLLLRTYLDVHSGEAGYGMVSQKAVMIGVNNMKRRRIRTLLTTATIVIIAFTMLSFTSISKKVNPTVVAKSRDVPYTGFMCSWPGKSMMDEGTLEVFRRLFYGEGGTVVRRWILMKNTPLAVPAASGRIARMEGVLGMQPEENGFLSSMPLVEGRFFTDNEANEALVFAGVADSLGIDLARPETATITFKGKKLQVVGLLDDTRFRLMKDLSGMPLMPIKRVLKDVAYHAQDQVAQPMEGDEFGKEDVYFYMDPSALLVLPEGLCRRLGGQPYSISLKLKSDASIASVMDRLLTATNAKFFIGSRSPFVIGADEQEEQPQVAAGVYYIGSNYSTSIGGLAVLIIPLLIAASIILNTMLGSVYERKKEIAVFNAIGLNPHHIGLFFLAESLVYGVIGSVGGYLIGQVLNIIISATGFIKGINLNYSSLSVAYVILFTIAIVLLSTLYPAIMATKAAVPSGKRKWSLPPHDGNTMDVVFPFIYQPSIALGIMEYLRSYFAAFSEASVGNLIAIDQGRKQETDAAGRPVYSMTYHLALAPYDLGVTQTIRFRLGYEERVQAFRLEMLVARLSGQDTNWVSTNRPFLERLRKYLMHWRNLDQAEHRHYLHEAGTIFNKS